MPKTLSQRVFVSSMAISQQDRMVVVSHAKWREFNCNVDVPIAAGLMTAGSGHATFGDSGRCRRFWTSGAGNAPILDSTGSTQIASDSG